jgi:hypothetical protein
MKTLRKPTAALRKGYMAWGNKVCWNAVASYDAGLHRTFADAQSAVEGQRPGSFGVMWRILEEPVCVVTDRKATFAFRLSDQYVLPALPPHITVVELATLVDSDTFRPVFLKELATADRWEPYASPLFLWTSISGGGSSALSWLPVKQKASRSADAERWIAKLKRRLRR